MAGLTRSSIFQHSVTIGDGCAGQVRAQRVEQAMTIHLETQSDLEEAVHALVKHDPRLKPVLATAGMPALRRREPGFAGLAHIVCGQQLSTASAAAIWGRLSAAFDPFDHEAVRRARTDRLGGAGPCRRKVDEPTTLAA